MHSLTDEIRDLYGGNVRVRVSGIYIVEGKILLVNHSLYGKGRAFWSPPGGGVLFSETARGALKREIKEETGLEAEIGSFLFVNEHVQPPLHAIELFFEVKAATGEIRKGTDPEISETNQIIEEVRLMDMESILALPSGAYHSVLGGIRSLNEIFNLGPFLAGS